MDAWIFAWRRNCGGGIVGEEFQAMIWGNGVLAASNIIAPNIKE
jgi:hypothetical protein